MPHALLVESEDQLLEPLTAMAKRMGFSSSCAKTLREARAMMKGRDADMLLLDATLPDGNGCDLLRNIQPQELSKVILMSDTNQTIDLPLREHVEACVTKPVDMQCIESHMTHLSERCQCNTAPQVSMPTDYGPLLGNCAAMREVYRMIVRVAPTDATVLLVGESGTGKEMVAQCIHQRSDRRKNPMIPVNCGAIPENLIESELFGHEKGSFTGANQLRRGVFERASGGTLLLDEITEMPAELQVRLLRVLETHKIVRVGGEREIPVDVRVIAATNRSPAEAVKDNKLREDLLYRLSVFPLHVPPLRERGTDIDMLAQHFLAKLNAQHRTRKELGAGALEQLRDYPWPGNVRHLKNVIHRSYIMADNVIESVVLPLPGNDAVLQAAHDLKFKVGTSLAEAEKHMIYATLSHYDGDKRQTAQTLGISLKTLYNRLNEYKTAPISNR